MPKDPDDPTITYADYTHCQLTSIESLALPSTLTHLILRRNRLTSLSPLPSLFNLVHLDLYDNGLTAIPDLSNLAHLVYLDLSFNKIADLDTTKLPRSNSVRELYLASNRIDRLPGALPQGLRIFECGANRLSGLVDLNASLPQSIEEVYLAANAITTVNCTRLGRLRILALQFNRIEIPAEHDSAAPQTIGGESLEEVYFGNNRLSGINFSFPRARILDLSSNQLRHINCSAFPLVEEMWLEGNQFDSPDCIQNLSSCLHLCVLYLQDNPMGLQYRQVVKGLANPAGCTLEKDQTVPKSDTPPTQDPISAAQPDGHP